MLYLLLGLLVVFALYFNYRLTAIDEASVYNFNTVLHRMARQFEALEVLSMEIRAELRDSHRCPSCQMRHEKATGTE